MGVVLLKKLLSDSESRDLLTPIRDTPELMDYDARNMEEFVFTNMYGCTTGSICGEAREAKLRPQNNKALQSFALTQNPCSTI